MKYTRRSVLRSTALIGLGGAAGYGPLSLLAGCKQKPVAPMAANFNDGVRIFFEGTWLFCADDASPTTRELRTVLAGSAFVVLVDIFFVSIVALTGGSAVLALSSIAMAAVGLLATRELIPRAKRAGNFSRSSRHRRLNLAFASISVVGYSVQLGLAVALLGNTRSAALQRALVLVLVAFYGSALGRAWEVTGITRRG